jgi:hypothetical protein
LFNGRGLAVAASVSPLSGRDKSAAPALSHQKAGEFRVRDVCDSAPIAASPTFYQ